MDVKFLIAGDRAVSVEFGSVISLEVNAKVRALDEKLKESPIEGMVETVPTYCALIVHYRPEVIRYSKLVEELEKRIADMHEVSTTTKKVVTIVTKIRNKKSLNQSIQALTKIYDCFIIRWMDKQILLLVLTFS